MFFFNLSLPQFLMLFTAASGVLVALYLLDRTKQRITVPTLRFWAPALQPAEEKQRRRIQQPWSLLLQLISIALLLLAIAQLRWGLRERGTRDHVLILDTSAWMAARVQVQGQSRSLMELAKAQALGWLRSIPAGDRVMVLRADAGATPVTAFESKREVTRKAIEEAQAGSTALRWQAALDYARMAQAQQGKDPGEIAYAGAGRAASDASGAEVKQPEQIRILAVKGPPGNVGIRKIAARRSAKDPDVWEVFVLVRNSGLTPKAVPFEARFGGAPWAARTLNLPPLGEREFSFEYRNRAAGLLEARLLGQDGFAADNRAIVELPGSAALRVAVYSNRRELLEPLLRANVRIQARYAAAGEPVTAEPDEVVILDRMAAPADLKAAALLIEPPGEGRAARAVKVTAGLQTKDLLIEQTQLYPASESDTVFAQGGGGALIVGKAGAGPKRAWMGFQPLASPLKYELAAPLMFAQVLEWLAPRSFARWELNAGSPGMIQAEVEEQTPVQVLDEQGRALPFTREGRIVRFFAGAPGSVRLVEGAREAVYSLTLPETGEAEIAWPKGVRRGVPAAASMAPSWRELWYALAIAGALGLLAEWLVYGLGRGWRWNWRRS